MERPLNKKWIIFREGTPTSGQEERSTRREEIIVPEDSFS